MPHLGEKVSLGAYTNSVAPDQPVHLCSDQKPALSAVSLTGPYASIMVNNVAPDQLA